MARLSDLVNVNINRNTITVQGKKIPVIFSMKAFPYIEEAYGETYPIFEAHLNRKLQEGILRLGEEEVRLMRALIYGMVRAGGTECTPEEIEGAIPPNAEMLNIFKVVLELFTGQRFQPDDQNKIKKK